MINNLNILLPEIFLTLSKSSPDIGLISFGSNLPLSVISIEIFSLPRILWQRPQPIQRPLFVMSVKDLIFVKLFLVRWI